MPKQRTEKRIYQAGRYWLDREPDNPNWLICWYDSGSRKVRRRTTGTTDLEEAKDRLDEHWLRNRRPENADPAAVSVRNLFNIYYQEHGARLPSAGQIVSSRDHWFAFWRHIEAEGAAITCVDDLSAQMVERFIAWMRARPLASGQNRTMQAIDRNIADLRAAINRAWKHRLIKSAPFIPGIPKHAKEGPRTARMPLEAVAELLRYAAHPRHKTLQSLVVGALCTVARPEAVLDISADPAREQVHLPEMRLNLNPKGRAQTKKFRPIIPLVPVLVPWLERGGWLVEWKGCGVASIKSAWRNARRELGFPEDWLPKTIRYTVASELRRRRVDKWELEGWLGHRDTSSTDVYATFDPDYLGTVTPALSDYLEELTAAAKMPLHPNCTRDAATIHMPPR